MLFQNLCVERTQRLRIDCASTTSFLNTPYFPRVDSYGICAYVHCCKVCAIYFKICVSSCRSYTSSPVFPIETIYNIHETLKLCNCRTRSTVANRTRSNVYVCVLRDSINIRVPPHCAFATICAVNGTALVCLATAMLDGTNGTQDACSHEHLIASDLALYTRARKCVLCVKFADAAPKTRLWRSRM